MYRYLVNMRNSKLLSEKYLNIQDEFLKEYNHDIVNFNDLSPIKNNSQLYLFQGDITTLKIDGIVNAANSDLLGCFIKGHHCIDNIIHTKAGVQLRYECSKIMEAQGRKEARSEEHTSELQSRFDLVCRRLLEQQDTHHA